MEDPIEPPISADDITPEFSDDLCVHAVSPRASCRRCVEACPHDALLLDDGALGIDVDRCDGCGLCIPACPQAAIALPTFGAPLVAGGRAPRAFAVCERAGQPAAERGQVACVHAIGSRDLLALSGRAVEELVLAHGDCEACDRRAATSIEDHAEEARRSAACRGEQPLAIRFTSLASFREERDAASRLDRRALFSALLPRAPQPSVAVEQGAARSASSSCLAHAPFIDISLCTACGACVAVCPHAVFVRKPAVGASASIVIDAAQCTGCGLCSDVCDDAAVSLRRWPQSRPMDVPLVEIRCCRCGNRFSATTGQAPREPRSHALCHVCRARSGDQKLFVVLP